MKLTWLKFPHSRVSDLSPLKDMKLKYLNCLNSQVSDLSPLKDMKLTYLNCNDSPVKDLSPLKGMPLEHLYCGNTQVSDLSPLKGMPLTHLACYDTQVSDLSPLKDMKLTALGCFRTKVSDAGLMPLQEMSSLRVLEIFGPKMTEAGLVHLKKLTELEQLNIGDTKLTSAGLVHLKGMTRLQELNLSNTELTDEGLVHLKGLLGLRKLHLHQTRVTDVGLEHLAGLKVLAELTLNGTAVTAKGVAKLKAALPNCNIHADVKVPASEPAATPKVIPSPPPSAALEALRRDQIPPEALTLAGDGDPKRAPASVVAVLGEAQPIHSSEVWGLAYSPDGRWLASASFDRTILLRDTATGRVKRVLQGHTAPVIAVAFSKDGRTVVSASHDGTLRLWPVAKDEKPLIVEAKLGQPAIQAMAVSPDGRFVAAGAETGLIKLWKWGEWAKPVEFPALTGKVKIRSLAFSPDGELLACGGHEEKEPAPRVRLYATADGTPKGSLPLNAKGILAVSFSHDGKHVAAAAHEGEGWGRVWEVASGKSVMELTRVIIPGEWRYAFSVAWGPDDKTLAVGAHMRVMVYDFPTGAKRTLWFGADQAVRGLSFSPHGDMLAAAGSHADMPVWSTTTWKLKFLERGHSRYVRAVAISPDGRELLSLGDEMALLRWDLARPGEAVVCQLDFGSDTHPYLHAVSYSPDGKSYVTPGLHLIAVRNTVSGKETLTRTLPRGLGNAAVSPDARFVAGAGDDGFIHLWDLALGRDVHAFSISGRKLWCGLAFSRDGKFLSSCNEETKRVTIWNVGTGDEGRSWEVQSVSRVSTFSPQGQIVATGHDDGTIVLWDSATGQKKRALAGHSAPIRSLKFTPDGKTLVSSGDDGIIRLWNPENVRRGR